SAELPDGHLHSTAANWCTRTKWRGGRKFGRTTEVWHAKGGILGPVCIPKPQPVTTEQQPDTRGAFACSSDRSASQCNRRGYLIFDGRRLAAQAEYSGAFPAASGYAV